MISKVHNFSQKISKNDKKTWEEDNFHPKWWNLSIRGGHCRYPTLQTTESRKNSVNISPFTIKGIFEVSHIPRRHRDFSDTPSPLQKRKMKFYGYLPSKRQKCFNEGVSTVTPLITRIFKLSMKYKSRIRNLLRRTK